MSAINLLSVNPNVESLNANAVAATLPARGEEASRSFRQELIGTDRPARPEAGSTPIQGRTPAAADREIKRNPADAAVRGSREAPTQAVESESTPPTAAQANESALRSDPVDAASDDAVVAPAGDASAVGGPAAVLADVVVIEGEDPVLSLVSDLVAAIENVFANSPSTEALADPVAADSPQAPLLAGLVALYEALRAVTAGYGLSGLTNPATAAASTPLVGVAPATSGVGSGSNGGAVVGSIGADAQGVAVTAGDASTNQQADDQNPSGQNGRSGNAATANAASASATTPNAAGSAGVSPLFDPSAGDAGGARPVTTTITPPTNAAGLTTQISPAGVTETNPAQDALNSARLQRGLSSAVNQQNGSVTLRLTPPELGTVRIQLNMQGGNVSAQFHAETESARTLLTQQLGQLRSSLEAQGLNVEKLGVQAMAGSANSSGLQQQSGNDSSPQNQSQANPDGRSRGQFGQSSQQGRQDPDDDPRQAATPTSFTQLLDADAAAQL